MRFVLFLLFFPSLVFAEKLSSPVVDEANVFTTEEEKSLVVEIEALQKKTNRWLVIHTVQALPEMSIDEYAVKKFEQWEIGERGKDNGLLLVIAMKDRKYRLEVGYGLEGEIPDARADEIMRDQLVPSLRAGNFYAGVGNVIVALGGNIPVIIVEPTAEEIAAWEIVKQRINQRFFYPADAFEGKHSHDFYYVALNELEKLGVFVSVTNKPSTLSDLPADKGQRVLIEVLGQEVKIIRDPEGKFTSSEEQAILNSQDDHKYEAVLTVLQDLFVRLRETAEHDRLAKVHSDYRRAIAISSHDGFKVSGGAALLLFLISFLLAIVHTSRARKEIKTIESESLKRRLRSLVWTSLWKLPVFLLLPYSFLILRIRSEFTFMNGITESNSKELWEFSVLLVFLGGITVFVFQLLPKLFDFSRWKRRLEPVYKEFPEEKETILRVEKAFHPPVSSYGGGSSGGSSSSSSWGSSSSSSSGGGRSGGGGASGSW